MSLDGPTSFAGSARLVNPAGRLRGCGPSRAAMRPRRLSLRCGGHQNPSIVHAALPRPAEPAVDARGSGYQAKG